MSSSVTYITREVARWTAPNRFFPTRAAARRRSFRCDYARFFPFWYKLTPGQQKRLAGYCTLRQFCTGENIYFHQICNGGMYFVYEELDPDLHDLAAREATIYHRYRGQRGIVIPLYENRPENIIPVFQAEEDSTLAYISKIDMYRATQENPDMQELYLNVTAECIQEVVNTFFSFAFLPLQSRVARILLDRLRADGNDRRVVNIPAEMLSPPPWHIPQRGGDAHAFGKMQAGRHFANRPRQGGNSGHGAAGSAGIGIKETIQNEPTGDCQNSRAGAFR